ncbi:MAG: hypothetical protein WCL51_12680 [Bacteroidota bacterium]
MGKEIKFSNDGELDPEKVKIAVFNQIDFALSEYVWSEINNAFSICWNDEIGIRGWIYEGQIEKSIYNYLINQKILIDYDKIEKIVEIILDYIKITGGFLKD